MPALAALAAAAFLSLTPPLYAATTLASCTVAADPDAPLRTIMPTQIPAFLAEQRGCVVLLEVYASWCGTCTRTAPELTALVERLRPHGLAVVGVSVDTSTERLQAWRQTHGREVAPVVVEGWTLANLTETFASMGVTFEEAIPLLVLLDGQGRVVLYQTEPKSLAALETAARELLMVP